RSLLSRVEVADSTLQEGQGMHGSFSRADTFNAMLAFGPDFKSSFADSAPTSNADIAVTIASILQWNLPSGNGKLRGRVLKEALKGGPDAPAPEQKQTKSAPDAKGFVTVLHYQRLEGATYYDQACKIQISPDTQPTCK